MKVSTRSFASYGPWTRSNLARYKFLCPECRVRAVRAAAIAPFHSTRLRNAPKPPRDEDDGEDPKERQPFLERIRRKVWQPGVPLGQKDPYAREGPGTEQLPTPKEPEPAAPKQPAAPPTPTILSEAYIPASTWDGLDRIGGASGWWEEQWDAEHPFNGFAPAKRASPKETRRLIRSLLINVVTLRQAGINVSRAAKISPDTIDYSMVKLGWSEKTQARVWYPDGAMQEEIINLSISDLQDKPRAAVDRAGVTELEAPDSSQEDATQAGSQLEGRDSHFQGPSRSEPVASDSPIFSNDSWLHIPIRGMRFKFLFLKRVTQLTGFRFPDHAITGISTVKDVIDLAVEKPKPKKLAELLLQDPAIAALPNIEIFDRRQTPIDKEKEVGRWKIIEQELREKGLPVTGTR